MSGRAGAPDASGPAAPGHERETRAALLRLDRRRFLGVAAGAGLCVGGTLVLGCGGVPQAWRPPAGLRLAVLGPRAYATFNAASARLLGPTAARAIGRGLADPAAAADAWLVREPALRGPLQQALWFLEWGVRPLVAKWRPFTHLDDGARDAVLEDLMRSRIDLKRDLFKGIRSLAMLGFYTGPAGRDLASYPGPFGGPDGAGIAEAMRYPLMAPVRQPSHGAKHTR